jgi:hypothetical protein
VNKYNYETAENFGCYKASVTDGEYVLNILVYKDILKMMSTLFCASVLRISSAHNKGGPPDINIAQILHLSNFFESKRIVYIHLQV